MQSASIDRFAVASNAGATVMLPPLSLVWRQRQAATAEGAKTPYRCPFYLYSDRKDLLFTADLPSQESIAKLMQMGVAVIAGN